MCPAHGSSATPARGTWGHPSHAQTKPKGLGWSWAAKTPKEELQTAQISLDTVIFSLPASSQHIRTFLRPCGGLWRELGAHFSTWMFLLPRGAETFSVYSFPPLLIASFYLSKSSVMHSNDEPWFTSNRCRRWHAQSGITRCIVSDAKITTFISHLYWGLRSLEVGFIAGTLKEKQQQQQQKQWRYH